MREPDQRHHVELNLADLAVEVQRVERAERPEARIVHEQLDRSLRRATAVFDHAELCRHGEVGPEYVCGGAVRIRELLRDRLEPPFVARDEHEIVPPFGE